MQTRVLHERKGRLEAMNESKDRTWHVLNVYLYRRAAQKIGYGQSARVTAVPTLLLFKCVPIHSMT